MSSRKGYGSTATVIAALVKHKTLREMNFLDQILSPIFDSKLFMYLPCIKRIHLLSLVLSETTQCSSDNQTLATLFSLSEVGIENNHLFLCLAFITVACSYSKKMLAKKKQCYFNNLSISNKTQKAITFKLWFASFSRTSPAFTNASVITSELAVKKNQKHIR